MFLMIRNIIYIFLKLKYLEKAKSIYQKIQKKLLYIYKSKNNKKQNLKINT
jgi:hypothetical protein